MTAFTTLLNALFLVDKPITSSIGLALRDNVSATAEGAVGAPRIEDAALSTTATTAGRNWLISRTILLVPGDVGATSMMSHQGISSVTYEAGDTTAGSNLLFTSGSVNSSTPGTGTWRCFGYCRTANTGTYALTDPIRKTLWMRIT